MLTSILNLSGKHACQASLLFFPDTMKNLSNILLLSLK